MFVVGTLRQPSGHLLKAVVIAIDLFNSSPAFSKSPHTLPDIYPARVSFPRKVIHSDHRAPEAGETRPTFGAERQEVAEFGRFVESKKSTH